MAINKQTIINKRFFIKTVKVVLLINLVSCCWILPQIIEPAVAIEKIPCPEGSGGYINISDNNQLDTDMRAVQKLISDCGNCLQCVMLKIHTLSMKQQLIIGNHLPLPPGNVSTKNKIDYPAPNPSVPQNQSNLNATSQTCPERSNTTSGAQYVYWQKKFLNCGEDVTCYSDVYDEARKAFEAGCQTEECKIIAANDVGISQVLWQIEDLINEEYKKRNESYKPPELVTDQQANKILNTSLDSIGQKINTKLKTEIDAYANQFPITGRTRPDSIKFMVDETSQTKKSQFVPDSRNWAYALIGGAYTIFGSGAELREGDLNVGFYCYLKAASFNPKDVSHLSNVAYHIGLKNKHKNALYLLKYAQKHSEDDAVLLENMSYNYRELKMQYQADLSLLKATAYNLYSPELRQKLAERLYELGLTKKSGSKTEHPHDFGLTFFIHARELQMAQCRLLPELFKDFNRNINSQGWPVMIGEVDITPPVATYSKISRRIKDELKFCTSKIPPESRFQWQRLKKEFAECRCKLQAAKKDLRAYRNYMWEERNLVEEFAKVWLPILDNINFYWKKKLNRGNLITPENMKYLAHGNNAFGAQKKSMKHEILDYFNENWVFHLENERSLYQENLALSEQCSKKSSQAVKAFDDWVKDEAAKVRQKRPMEKTIWCNGWLVRWEFHESGASRFWADLDKVEIQSTNEAIIKEERGPLFFGSPSESVDEKGLKFTLKPIDEYQISFRKDNKTGKLDWQHSFFIDTLLMGRSKSKMGSLWTAFSDIKDKMSPNQTSQGITTKFNNNDKEFVGGLFGCGTTYKRPKWLRFRH